MWLEIRKFAPSPPSPPGEFPNRHISDYSPGLRAWQGSDQAEILQREANELLDPLTGHLAPDPANLKQVTEWHDKIVAGGLYGSRVRVGLSILLPLLLPIVSLIQTAIGWLLR